MPFFGFSSINSSLMGCRILNHSDREIWGKVLPPPIPRTKEIGERFPQECLPRRLLIARYAAPTRTIPIEVIATISTVERDVEPGDPPPIAMRSTLLRLEVGMLAQIEAPTVLLSPAAALHVAAT